MNALAEIFLSDVCPLQSTHYIPMIPIYKESKEFVACFINNVLVEIYSLTRQLYKLQTNPSTLNQHFFRHFVISYDIRSDVNYKGLSAVTDGQMVQPFLGRR